MVKSAHRSAMRIGPLNITWKSLSNPTEAEFSLFSGYATGDINPLSVPAVQSAIRLISEACASLDIWVERKIDGNWTKQPEHPITLLIEDRPNNWTSTFDFIRDLVATALTNDQGGVAFVNRIDGDVREIVRYQPAHVTIDFSENGRLEPSFKINNSPALHDDIIHLRSAFSKCPLRLAQDAISTSKHMENHARNLFQNAARPGGVLETPKNVGDAGVTKMLKGWKAAMEGSGNAGKTPILWDGTKFVPMSLNSTDAQFLENRKYQTLEICRAFRVPPSMIYELDRATWSNGEQQGKEFLSYSLEPWLRALEAAMRRAVFSADERADHRIRFDRDDLTRADLTARSTAISSLRSSETLTRNEGRSWLDLPPVEDGDSFENPNINTQPPASTARSEEAANAA